MSETEDIKNKLKRKVSPIPTKDFLSTGSTLLNLACSGKVKGGLAKGHYYLLAGKSSSGKTVTAMHMLAEASINAAFKDYRLIFDNPENGMLMDVASFFGSTLAKRIEPPNKTGSSTTVEEFYFNLDDACEINKPFIYVLDSMDALESQESQDKFSEVKKATRANKEITGSYGMAKAKANSGGLRRITSYLTRSNSILIIICQLRDNVGFGSQYNPEIFSGGKALRYYASLILWFAVKEEITKTINGKKRKIGSIFNVRIKKNRIDGKERTVDVVFHESTGIDDTESCVDYLLDEKHWKDDKGIDAEEFKVTLKKDKLITYIEEKDLEADLRDIVSGVWDAIEMQCEVKRKPRYQ